MNLAFNRTGFVIALPKGHYIKDDPTTEDAGLMGSQRTCEKTQSIYDAKVYRKRSEAEKNLKFLNYGEEKEGFMILPLEVSINLVPSNEELEEMRKMKCF